MAQGNTLVKELQTVERPQPVNVANGLATLIERLADNPNVDVEKLERLIAAQERILAVNAKAAFDAAFSVMQGEIPPVVERGKTNNGTYARLEDIVEAVRPILSRHGFALTHRTEWPDAKTVKVIGILTHEQGHERQSEFLSGADSSGNKNAIQGLGSALSYGRRYTAKDLLNIVTRGEDDDGGRTSRKPAPAPPDGFDAWLNVIEKVAEDGWPALKAAWDKSKPEFRNYLSQYGGNKVEALKAKARSVQR